MEKLGCTSGVVNTPSFPEGTDDCIEIRLFVRRFHSSFVAPVKSACV